MVYFDKNFGYYGHSYDLNEIIPIAIEKGDIPSFDSIYVKQNAEILYLSESQYNKVLESGIFITGDLKTDLGDKAYDVLMLDYLLNGTNFVPKDMCFRYIDKINNLGYLKYYSVSGGGYVGVSKPKSEWEEIYLRRKDYYIQWYKNTVEILVVK